MGKTKGGYYAVARGQKVGIYLTWDECQTHIKGFPNARYKKFPSQSEAQAFIDEYHGGSGSSSSSSKSASSIVSEPFNHLPAIPIIGTQRSKVGKGERSSPFFKAGSGTTPSSALAALRNLHTTARLDLRGLRDTEEKVTGRGSNGNMAVPNETVDLTQFQVDIDNYVVVYTDGACTKNGRVGAKAGIGVWFGNNHPLNISEPVLGRQTNNAAEILAVERAVLQAKSAGITKLKLMTDSQFTINCATSWIEKWKKNGWRLATGHDVKNKEDLQKLDAAIQGIEIKWCYVPGHCGHHGNEQADKLAVKGANKPRE